MNGSDDTKYLQQKNEIKRQDQHGGQAGADPSAIRDVLGHANAETTWRYTRVSLEMKRKAIESYGPDHAAGEPPVPLWRRDSDLLAELESIGRRRRYVER